MLFKTLSLTALLAFGGLVDARDSDPVLARGCGSLIDAVKQSVLEKQFQVLRSKSRAGANTGPLPPVNVYFHIISANETAAGGNLSDDTVQFQMHVINKAYEPAGLQFNLVKTTRTTNPEWFAKAGPSSPDIQTPMKAASREGGPGDLNVWTIGFEEGPDRGLLGYATFPHEYKDAPGNDGVVILHSSLPGGALNNYNLGHTLTHEVGHWVGLYHTFQGGCEGPGDQVDDTPAELFPAQGCPIGRKTCKDTEGMDPVQNFMDYSYDSCMNNFTEGQIARLRDQIATFRSMYGQPTREPTPEQPPVTSVEPSSSVVEPSVDVPSAVPAVPSVDAPSVVPSPSVEVPSVAVPSPSEAAAERETEPSTGSSLLSFLTGRRR
ncbi:metalloprotease 1 [Coprinopsis sp. MPI-PUGE-AT-0042]|nr:metalloprotease 1 [Coprinopsis sp. MPI-PUGE-AT-0042]